MQPFPLSSLPFSLFLSISIYFSPFPLPLCKPLPLFSYVFIFPSPPRHHRYIFYFFFPFFFAFSFPLSPHLCAPLPHLLLLHWSPAQCSTGCGSVSSLLFFFRFVFGIWYLYLSFGIAYLASGIWYLGQCFCPAPAADLSALYSFPSALYLVFCICI